MQSGAFIIFSMVKIWDESELFKLLVNERELEPGAEKGHLRAEGSHFCRCDFSSTCGDDIFNQGAKMTETKYCNLPLCFIARQSLTRHLLI